MTQPVRFFVVAVVLSYLGTIVTGQPATTLEARYIGQMAFAITDGTVRIITDFPYQIGYAGAGPYDRAETGKGVPSLALVTHRHADHWEPRIFAGTDWKLVGPADVTAGISAARVLPRTGAIEFGPVRIQPLVTPHARIPHYSYIVTWHGKRLYFSGDTESPDSLLQAKGIDVAFVSPWLYRSILRSGRRPDAKRFVIYHHEADERVDGCDEGCTVPRPGETIQIR